MLVSSIKCPPIQVPSSFILSERCYFYNLFIIKLLPISNRPINSQFFDILSKLLHFGEQVFCYNFSKRKVRWHMEQQGLNRLDNSDIKMQVNCSILMTFLFFQKYYNNKKLVEFIIYCFVIYYIYRYSDYLGGCFYFVLNESKTKILIKSLDFINFAKF